MPLVRVEVKNEYGLGLHELYGDANREDPKAVLDGVAVAGLVGILRQLGDLAEYVFLFYLCLIFGFCFGSGFFSVVALASGSWECASRVLEWRLWGFLDVFGKSNFLDLIREACAISASGSWKITSKNCFFPPLCLLVLLLSVFCSLESLHEFA